MTKEGMRARRQAFIAAGLCASCGKERDRAERKCCDACIQRGNHPGRRLKGVLRKCANPKCPRHNKPFHPWHRRTTCCSKRCANEVRILKMKGRPLPWKPHTKQVMLTYYRERLQARVREKFGTLTPREAELFNFAYVQGRLLTYSRRRSRWARIEDAETGAA